ncbi:unnamed protein product [Rhizophagus irregularis]|nr:unnamed protein product [Rhizophagus irregularis]
MVEVERIYDNLSIISSYETPQQWAIRVKDTLQALITEGHRSYYHVFCLFRSSEQGVTKTYYNDYEGREVAIEAVLKRPAHLLENSKSEILHEKSSDRKGGIISWKNTSDSLLQFNRTSESEIFISSIYAKQNNLNHLNQPKGTVLRLRDGIVITIV